MWGCPLSWFVIEDDNFLSAPDGPHVGPMNFAIMVYIHQFIIPLYISPYPMSVPARLDKKIQ